MNKRFPKTRKRRRFRPLRRLLLVAILGLLVYGLVNLGMWSYRTVFVPRIGLATAELVPEGVSFSARAVVVRDEVVVVASRAGTLKLLAEHTQEILSNQPLLELVDMPLLAAIDRQLAEEEKKHLDVSSQSEDYVEHKGAQLTVALDEFRSLMAKYASLMRVQNTIQANAVFKDIERMARSVDKLHNEYEHASRSAGQFETVQAELLEQRQSAILTVTSPVDGLVSFRIDSRGSDLRPSLMSSIELGFLQELRDDVVSMETGASIAAGQPVCTVINPSAIYLLVTVEGGLRPDIESAFEMRVQNEVISAVFLRAIPTAEDDTYIYHYAVDGAPQVLLDSRVVSAEFRPLGVVAVSIPRKAIVSMDGIDKVYGPNDAGVIVEYMVKVRDLNGRSATVLGLVPGQEIISTPHLVTPGDIFKNVGGGQF